MKKSRLILLVGALLFWLTPIPLYAESVDLNQEGSLIIKVHTSAGEAVPGGDLKIYKVADIQSDDEGDSFVLTEAFKDSSADLSNPENRQTIAYLASYATSRNLESYKRIDPVPDDGLVDFENIPLGLYLVVQDQAAPGYEAMPPFLISVPNWDGEKYVYNVSAYPKSDPDKLPETPDNPDGSGNPPVANSRPNTAANSQTGKWTLLLSGAAILFATLFQREKQQQKLID